MHCLLLDANLYQGSQWLVQAQLLCVAKYDSRLSAAGMLLADLYASMLLLVWLSRGWMNVNQDSQMVALLLGGVKQRSQISIVVNLCLYL